MDSWESRAAYEEFREKLAAEYEELDAKCDEFTVNERIIGEHE